MHICSVQPTTAPRTKPNVIVIVNVIYVCFDLCVLKIQGLALQSIQDNKLLWKIRPKYHKFLGHCMFSAMCETHGNHRTLVWQLRLDHVVWDQASRVSPMHASCYLDEDSVGRVKRLAMMSSPLGLGYTVLQRYSAYTCVRWLRQLTSW